MVRESDRVKKKAFKNRAQTLLLEWNKVICKSELLTWRRRSIRFGVIWRRGLSCLAKMTRGQNILYLSLLIRQWESRWTWLEAVYKVLLFLNNPQTMRYSCFVNFPCSLAYLRMHAFLCIDKKDTLRKNLDISPNYSFKSNSVFLGLIGMHCTTSK